MRGSKPVSWMARSTSLVRAFGVRSEVRFSVFEAGGDSTGSEVAGATDDVRVGFSAAIGDGSSGGDLVGSTDGADGAGTLGGEVGGNGRASGKKSTSQSGTRSHGAVKDASALSLGEAGGGR